MRWENRDKQRKRDSMEEYEMWAKERRENSLICLRFAPCGWRWCRPVAAMELEYDKKFMRLQGWVRQVDRREFCFSFFFLRKQTLWRRERARGTDTKKKTHDFSASIWISSVAPNLHLNSINGILNNKAECFASTVYSSTTSPLHSLRHSRRWRTDRTSMLEDLDSL